MRARTGPIVIGLTAVFALALAACGGDDADATQGNANGNPQGAAVAQSTSPASNQGITVSGQGSVTVKPDTANVSIGVSTLARTARDARDRAADAMNKLLDSLKGSGIDEKDIATTQFSLGAEYDYNGSIRTFNGYRLTHTVSAKVRNIDRVAETLDAAVDAAGNDVQVGGISFTVDDPKSLASQARTAAMADAAAKAQQLADAGGVKLGKPVSVTETTYPSPMGMGGVASNALAAAGTTIQPGQLDVTVNVQVTYATE